ncbi:hypothetical protein DNTS_021392 [Danionella cerebrum]|uniref:Ribosomal protein eL8/eL30/eS12/Gadd45 domain-containing protein n=1 Tax=Danionella cerebrum TaxID=2873325 RepID=A0A553R0Z8_9TELE|nr:hypothetical protein DNTS_021392 [Danionella translucida]TRY95860.1 hypothetical protein DNTS_021392 [Danionella translucida]
MEDNLKRAVSKNQNQSSREDWFQRRQRSADNQDEMTYKTHGHNRNSQTNSSADLSFKKKLKDNRDEHSSHEKRTNRRSTDRGTKLSLNPTERVKPAFTSSCVFEMKLADFPELGELSTTSFSSAVAPISVKAPSPSAGVPAKPQSSTAIVCKDAAKQKAQQVLSSGCCETSPKIKADLDQSTAVANPTGLSALSSWANIASQPRKVIQKLPKANTSSQEDLSVQPQEQKNEKKKRKRKKKSKMASENSEEIQEEYVMQEPPKFEDEEEFPDLSLASELRGHSSTQKEGLSLHPEFKHKTSASADLKKTQTVTSQKKSKVPVQLDLGNMLTFLQQKQLSQKSKHEPVTLSVGGALPVVHKEASAMKKPRQQEKTPHNPLDSTGPSVKKGKQQRDPSRTAPELEDKQTIEDPFETGLAEKEPQIPTASDHKLESDSSENSAQKPENPISNPKLPKIHSRKFRDYCNQVLSKDVDECVSSLLKELVRFQDRLHQKDPMKARMKRRLVMGLREVLKHLKLKKVKCVIISPNCERIQSKGGLDEALHTIIDTCREQNVPFVFALSRKALGRCVSKTVPVSLVGIFNYDGAQDYYHKMIEMSAMARKIYEVMISNMETESEEKPEELQEVVPPAEMSGADEPEYVKTEMKVIEKDYNETILNLEQKLSSLSIGSESLLEEHEGS